MLCINMLTTVCYLKENILIKLCKEKNTYITNIYLYLQIDRTILYEAFKKRCV